MKSIINLAFIIIILGFEGNVYAQRVWSEKTDSTPLVNLPDLSPVIDQLDETVVNISSSSEPKKAQKPQRRQQPTDPFMDPQDFFDRFFGQPEGQQAPRRSMGSGFIISKDGYIVTNNHVIDGADKIEVIICQKAQGKNVEECPKSNKQKATLVGTDPATDIALLKIDSKEALPFAYLGDSNKLKKGDWVLAMGNPFGLSHSASLGIVSAKGREISPNENRRFDDFIQTDAAINFGNSGGPLVNLRGEVIGINTAITAQGSGIGFAVPVNLAKDIIAQLKDSGTVSRGYLGVTIQDVTEEIKDALKLGTASGVLVNDVLADGPAAKAGLVRGDVIVKIDGQGTPDARNLQKIVARIKPNKTVEIEIIRSKKTVKVSTKMGQLPGTEDLKKKPVEDEKYDKLGLIVRVNPETKFIEVVDIEANSPAEMAGVFPGDRIRRVNEQVVNSLSDYKKLSGSFKSGSTVFLDIERNSMKLFVAFRIP